MQFQDRNNTTTLWRQGIYTHTQAGRSDFLERARFARLFEAVFQIVNKLRACGIVDLDFLQSLYHSIDELNRGIRHPLTYQPDYTVMVYALHEDSSGVSQRGPLRDLAGAFLAPSAPYRIEYFDPVHMVYGVASFTSSASGIPTAPPTMNLVNISQMRDSDSDGLPDVAEGVLGTNPLLRDSDADGLSDLAEIQQGTDPLSGRAFPSGVIARLPLPGEAKEVVLEGSTLNSGQQSAYVALGSRGLGITDASQFQRPVALGQLDLSGDATDVAVDSNLKIVAVAANAGGLHLVNVANAMQPALRQTINVNASQVEIVGGIAYVAVGSQLWPTTWRPGICSKPWRPAAATSPAWLAKACSSTRWTPTACSAPST